MREREARYIGAEAKETQVGERDVAGEAADDVPAHRHRGIGEREVEEVKQEAVQTVERKRDEDHERHQRPGDREHLARVHRLSLATCPKKPCGRTIRTAKRKMKKTVAAQLAGTYRMVTCSAMPRMSAARSVPRKLPSPPRTTIAMSLPIQPHWEFG